MMKTRGLCAGLSVMLVLSCILTGCGKGKKGDADGEAQQTAMAAEAFGEEASSEAVQQTFAQPVEVTTAPENAPQSGSEAVGQTAGNGAGPAAGAQQADGGAQQIGNGAGQEAGAQAGPGSGAASATESPFSDQAPAVSSNHQMKVVNCNESITLRTSPSTSASEICQIPLGALVEYVGTEANGFYKIIYNGQTGYSLASYLAEQETTENYHFLTSSMYTYTEMEEDLDLLASHYGAYIKRDSLGTTLDGRELYHVLVGPEDAPNHVLIFGSIHAREYISTQVVMRQMERLLRQCAENSLYMDASVRSLLSHTAVHFVPMSNPDGVTISQLGPDGMLKEETKARLMQIYAAEGSSNQSQYFRVWKSNSNGVDLNRNFDAKWELYNDHVGRPSADHYKGTAFETEVESRALVELTESYPFKRTISYHTQGNVIYWYFEQTGALRDENMALANMAAAETGYWIDSDYTKLDPAGYKDWAISKMGIPSLTIEIGSGSSPVDPSQFSKLWEQNKNICQHILYDLKDK